MDIENTTQLPPHLEKARTRIGIGFKAIQNPTGTYGARAYQASGFDNSLSLPTFRRNCYTEVYVTNSETVLFDLVGVDAPIANAVRRILLAEVPTMAIETVFVHRNTSIMHDEQLAHRLGLVPLRIDPRPFEVWNKGDKVNAANTVKFRLSVTCEFNRDAPRDGEAPPQVLYRNSRVLSGHIEHVPFVGGAQDALLGDMPPCPVHEDILLCKLRPGQEIQVEMDATKNVGREHAKWSPVATAGYRMLPEVRLKEPVVGQDAQNLVELCPASVFDIEDGAAIVARPRDCTMCRECIRTPEWDRRVELTRKRDHFIFSVESTGALPAATLVSEALTVLINKCHVVLEALDHALKRRTVDGGGQRGENDGNDDDEDNDDDDDDDDMDD